MNWQIKQLMEKQLNKETKKRRNRKNPASISRGTMVCCIHKVRTGSLKIENNKEFL